MSASLIGVIVGLTAVVVVAVAFFGYQFWRARQIHKYIDYSKLRDWDDDQWND
ncbi:hypothetical protein [Salinisphaera orenii]|uniref:hypothetical protein n=1 Tax=Salinisphaera orenii TaxID=856731 RepID=UPI0013A64EA8